MIQNKESLLKKALKHLAVVVFFLLATVIYFSPEFFDGKSLPQHDVTQFQGSSQDIRAYYNQEGETSAWTGGMFSGMPAYQIGVWGGSPNILDYVQKPLKALGGSTAGPVFTAMLMAYFLFLILGFNIPTAVFGAIAYSLSSYNIIILEAGHVTKAWTLAYMPIVVGGVLAMFKNKFVVGGLCMALGLALQLKSNHLQITYYTGIFCFILYISLVVKQIKNKEFSALLKSSGILAIAVTLALLANASSIYSNYEMSRTSTRGKSELTSQSDGAKPSDGLGKDYVFGWSYGKAETLSLLIPNIYGGGSVTWLNESSNLYKRMVSEGYGAQIDQRGVQGYTYWGDQPGTSGPIYFGAIICFLFILGMIIIRHPLKWVFLGSTVFFIFLAWGKNFDAFNNLFYHYFPLYGKFRAVSQALVIPALTMVMVAVWAVKEFFGEEIDSKKRSKALYISAGVTAAICLLLWMAPNMFGNFTSASDLQWKEQMPDWFFSSLVADRKDMLQSDALRSFLFIVVAAAGMWVAANKSKAKSAGLFATGFLALLILGDLWTVDKRFLNDNKFVRQHQETTFKKSEADNSILQDKSLSYRVLNLNNPFGETATSYYHRSIGGYHAAKLQRYQQLIERRLQPELMNIHDSFSTQNVDSVKARFAQNSTLNMLDARYMILEPGMPAINNPYALGNAWFVSDYKLVENADAEMEALNSIDPAKDAVVDKRYADRLNDFSITNDSTAQIILTAYKPNTLTYKSKTNSDQLAVFSEVYYDKGWNAYIDGKLAPHFCADWILRAMIVPAGEHEIVFRFEPTGYNTSRVVATASSGILALLLAGTIFWCLMRKEEEEVKDI